MQSTWARVLRRPGEHPDHQDPRRRECPAKDSCILHSPLNDQMPSLSSSAPRPPEPPLQLCWPLSHRHPQGHPLLPHIPQARALPFPESERRKSWPSCQADSVRGHWDPSGSLSPTPVASQRGFPCVRLRQPSLSSGGHSMYPLSQTSFKSTAIQMGQQTSGRFITRRGSSWQIDTLFSPSPSFLLVGVAWGVGRAQPEWELPSGASCGGGGID